MTRRLVTGAVALPSRCILRRTCTHFNRSVVWSLSVDNFVYVLPDARKETVGEIECLLTANGVFLSFSSVWTKIFLIWWCAYMRNSIPLIFCAPVGALGPPKTFPWRWRPLGTDSQPNAHEASTQPWCMLEQTQGDRPQSLLFSMSAEFFHVPFLWPWRWRRWDQRPYVTAQ